MDLDLDLGTMILAAASAFGGALLTFFTANRDSVSKANEVAINSLLITINGLNSNTNSLHSRMEALDKQIDDLTAENIAMSVELHQLRAALRVHEFAAASSQCPLFTAQPAQPANSGCESTCAA